MTKPTAATLKNARAMKRLVGTRTFTEDEYLEVRFNNHDAFGPYTKVETFVAHGLAEEAGRIRRVDNTLTPDQMADFVNDCAGDDCYCAEWNFEWDKERGVFEDVTYVQLYQMA